MKITQQLAHLAVPIADLNLDPSNARKHGEKNLDAIKASLAKFGQRKPIVVQTPGMIVRAGNGTVTAARALGWTEIAAVVIDDDNATASQFAIADNRTSELADWDDETLAAILDGFDSETRELLAFDDADMRKLMRGLTPEIVEDEIPDPPAKPITKRGDVIVLGRHRLICGDATDRVAYDLVTGGVGVGLCLTDPPYGLAGASDKAAYRAFADTPEQVAAMAAQWLPICREISAAVVFSPGVVQQWWYPKPDWVICWFYGGGQHHSPWGFNCWQPFLCYGKDPSLSAGRGARPDAVDMNTPADAADIAHPCPKPIRLWHWLVERLHHDDSPILDPFAGSGTTLIAAEQLSRRCFGVEIDPAYCDVIVQRWEHLTGKTAVRPT